jgi:hypothetical protein
MVYMVYEKEKTLNERLDSWHEQRTTTVDYIYQNLEQAKIKMTLVVNFFLRFFSGVPCELCNPENSDAFSTRSPDHTVTLHLSNTRITEFMNISIMFTELNIFLSSLVKLFNFIGYKVEDMIENWYAKQRNFKDRIQIFKNCIKRVQQKKTFLGKDLCLDSFDFFRSMTHSPDIDRIVEVVDFGLQVLLPFVNGSSNKSQPIRKVAKDKYAVFLKKRTDEDILANFKIELRTEGGWDLLRNNYNDI